VSRHANPLRTAGMWAGRYASISPAIRRSMLARVVAGNTISPSSSLRALVYALWRSCGVAAESARRIRW